MKIINAYIYIDGAFSKGGIEFSDKIISVGPSVSESVTDLPNDAVFEDIMDAEEAYLIPGLIDIHTHGAVGHDASDGEAEGLVKLSKYYAAGGVTSFCPTMTTVPEDKLMRAMETVRRFERPEDGARIAAVNMEGPFLSPDRAGAQDPGALRLPDISMLDRLNRASGNIVKLVTVAPELEGAMGFIREAVKRTAVSVGHTCADYETAGSAYAFGASHLTHTFNCMPPVEHRAPGPIPAALGSGATAELITDGLHVHPSVVYAAHKLFGEKLVLVSDSLRCAGMPDGDYTLGGLDITMKGGRAVIKGTDQLAGSSIHLMEGMRRAVAFGIPLEDAVTACTKAPAKVVGVFDKTGSLSPGKCADIVMLGKDLGVKAVWTDGRMVRQTHI